MTTQEIEVDVAVLGAGTAGLAAQEAAEKAGAHAVVIDPGPLGTTCARVGCMPSKLLIAAAEAAHAVREASGFGVEVGALRVDGPAVLGRVRSERDRFVGSVLEGTDALERRGLLLRGAARFVGEDVLSIDGATRVRARRGIVVATGSAPMIPPPYRGLQGPRISTSDSVFELRDIPESVLVVGAGPLGLELGQALRRLGAQVTIVGVDGSIGGLTDPEVQTAATAALREELELHLEFKLQHVHEEERAVVARFVGDDGVVRERRYARLLLAAGREPVLAGLDLEAAGVTLADGKPEGLDTETLQVGGTRVFLAGDVAGIRPLLHEAADEGEIAGANAARWPKSRPGERRTPLALVFTDPQLAVVGRSFASLDPGTCAIGQVSFADQARARMMRKDRGALRVYAARRGGALLGAEIAGPDAEHLGHLLAWSIQQGLTVEAALRMPFYHPVLEEGLRTALRDLARALRGG